MLPNVPIHKLSCPTCGPLIRAHLARSSRFAQGEADVIRREPEKEVQMVEATAVAEATYVRLGVVIDTGLFKAIMGEDGREPLATAILRDGFNGVVERVEPARTTPEEIQRWIHGLNEQEQHVLLEDLSREFGLRD